MNISGFFQFILGFILGVLLLVMGSVGAAYYFFNRLAAAPPKPVFSETVPATPEVEKPAPTNETDKAAAPTDNKTETKTEEKEDEEEKIPEGAYKAEVSWSSGLSLRAEPDLNAERVGGVDYNTEVLVVEESDDKVWQKIRLSDGQEAWVKAGNVEKID
jgi:Bacterial SH3 domain